MAEELTGLRDPDEWPGGAEPEAADPLDGDIGHVRARDLGAESGEDVVRPLDRQLTASQTYADARTGPDGMKPSKRGRGGSPESADADCSVIVPGAA